MAILPNKNGVCPHCRIGVRFESNTIMSGSSNYGDFDPIDVVTRTGDNLEIRSAGCPSSGKPILIASRYFSESNKWQNLDIQIWPDTGNRPIPKEVENESSVLASDFREAVSVLPKSKKASAALSRRCLQLLLQEKAGIKKKNLSQQIDEVLDRLPSELAENVDAIRNVGNFAAHPLKATNTGEILGVEEGESEWLLDVLEELFDFYYVAPQKAAARRKALNEKLKELGKPTLKTKNINK